MFKQMRNSKGEKGFTLIELLVVAAIIGILLALAIPNLLKARISANEANAAKMMQTLRDAEGEYFEQDLNNDDTRNYTQIVGTNALGDSLRFPDDTIAFDEADALVDSSFEIIDSGDNAGDCSTTAPDPNTSKAGYCISHHSDVATGANARASGANGFDDFGWRATPVSFNKSGRRDYSVYSDGVIRCQLPDPQPASGTAGTFTSNRQTGGCR